MKTRGELLKKANETFPAHWWLLREGGKDLPVIGVFPTVTKVRFVGLYDTDVADDVDILITALFGRHQIILSGEICFRSKDEPIWLFRAGSFSVFAAEFAQYLSDIMRETKISLLEWGCLPE